MANSTLFGSNRSHSARLRVAGLNFSRRSHNSCEKRRMAIFEFTLGVTAGVQKQQINIGVREKPAAPESAGGDQREILGAVRSGKAGS